jgi:hypothetical protein
MKTTQLVTAKEFHGLVAQSKTDQFLLDRSSTMTVQGDVHIDNKDINLTIDDSSGRHGQSIRLTNIVFNGMVFIRGYTNLTLTISHAYFLEGLWIEDCSGSWISMTKCQVKSADFWCGGARGRTFEVVSLHEIHSQSSINLSGLNLKDRLSLHDVTASYGLELIHLSTMDTLHTPKAITNSSIWAFQLRMAGIPVFIDTKNAEMMMARDPSLLKKIA